ncbi:MAG TPA: hypothetical protein VHB30_11120 [Solirubrobacteraceae bacterium]|nr:hypothetical protein [Solirubrobacteraceae bacterium]
MRSMALVGGAAWALGAGAGEALAASPLPGATKATCPKPTAERLPAHGATKAAAREALREARTIYEGEDLTGARATAFLAAHSTSPRALYAKQKCGVALWRRTVVIEMTFPAMLPSASLSQAVVLVARFHGAYRVWAVLH